jgi:hypothetical protein
LNTTHQTVTVCPAGRSDVRSVKLAAALPVTIVDPAPATCEPSAKRYTPDSAGFEACAEVADATSRLAMLAVIVISRFISVSPV